MRYLFQAIVNSQVLIARSKRRIMGRRVVVLPAESNELVAFGWIKGIMRMGTWEVKGR